MHLLSLESGQGSVDRMLQTVESGYDHGHCRRSRVLKGLGEYNFKVGSRPSSNKDSFEAPVKCSKCVHAGKSKVVKWMCS